MTVQKNGSAKFDLYQVVTDKIIEKLEAGTVPWKASWFRDESGLIMPTNLFSGKPYRGINTLLLSCMPYDSRYYLTFKQAQERGGNVKKGEKSTMIIFWNFIQKISTEVNKDGSTKLETIPFMRYYNVFNVEQCSGIDYPKPKIIKQSEYEQNLNAESVLNGMQNKPKIIHAGQQPYYQPSNDAIVIPQPEMFQSTISYYSVLFHELTHSTLHPSRLDRKIGCKEHEELVAEMGSSFLSAFCGFENQTLDDSAAYIAEWTTNIRNNKKLVVQAAQQAQKCTDYILDLKEEKSIELEQAA